MDQSSQALILVVVLALVVAGALLESWWRKFKVRSDARAAVKRGLKGERDAEKLLKKLGYTIVAKQAPANYAVLMNGELLPFQLTADFIVELAGKRLVAEVKTGKAIKLDNAETRRQLLEYQLAFAVESLLLVDMESKVVHTVRFPLPNKSASAATAVRRMTVRWAAIAMVAVGVAWFATTLTSPGESTPAHSE